MRSPNLERDRRDCSEGVRCSGERFRGSKAKLGRKDNREISVPNAEAEGTAVAAAAATASHGIEVAVEFKPVEHPIEPLSNDRPVKCPLPEPSILNDGRIWKERMSASVRRSTDLPVMKDGNPLESESNGSRPRSSQSNRLILPSLSAPEHNLINLLEECNAAGI